MRNSVLDYFEDTVNKYPQKEAIIDANGAISFRDMKVEALKIASLIEQHVCCKKKPFLIYIPKNRRMITAFLATLYTGNFYTPTDVTFPFPKIQRVIEQLEPELILTDTEHMESLLDNGVKAEIIVNLDDAKFHEMWSGEYSSIVDTDIVYTLFTSGSTGIPKGVAVCNRSIIDYIDWAKETYNVTEQERIANQAPFYFDNSTLDIYLMLSTGATLYIVPEMYYAFPARLMEYLVNNKINFVFWVPSVLINVANNELLSKFDCSELKKVLFAGEVMPNKHLNYWRKHLPNALFSNLYGPTEITVDCTYYIVDRIFTDEEPLPIGIACKNSHVFILDENNEEITEPNMQGELCVRGSSLALGYWNNPEKTKDVFTQNPLNKNLPELIYRTGDLAYYNEWHEFMFAGRKDSQIKHMGYRIELGEIETAVLGLKEIENACVGYDFNGRRIVLFYQAEKEINDRDIRRKLMAVIPKYMIPTDNVYVKMFEYTDNGKIDRNKMMQMFLSERGKAK